MVDAARVKSLLRTSAAMIQSQRERIDDLEGVLGALAMDLRDLAEEPGPDWTRRVDEMLGAIDAFVPDWAERIKEGQTLLEWLNGR